LTPGHTALEPDDDDEGDGNEEDDAGHEELDNVEVLHM
jgi:hypothetical protein